MPSLVVASAFVGIECTEASLRVGGGPGVAGGLGPAAGLGQIAMGAQQGRAPLAGILSGQPGFAVGQVDVQGRGLGVGDPALPGGFFQGTVRTVEGIMARNEDIWSPKQVTDAAKAQHGV